MLLEIDIKHTKKNIHINEFVGEMSNTSKTESEN